MDVTVTDITRYLDHLSACGLHVTLHGDIVSCSELLPYNFHKNPYCYYIKNCLPDKNACADRQQRIYEKCAGGPFFGCCWAGVGEFIYPLTRSGKCIGFVSVSGYLDSAADRKLESFIKKNKLDAAEVDAMRRRYLTTQLPDKAAVDTLLRPLLLLLLCYDAARDKTGRPGEEELYRSLLQYLSDHCHRAVSMQELSNQFHYSPSTLSRFFRRKSGMTLPGYILSLRLCEAERLLKEKRCSVSEIARFLGFCNPGYFATVFRRRYGVSPKQYRLR